LPITGFSDYLVKPVPNPTSNNPAAQSNCKSDDPGDVQLESQRPRSCCRAAWAHGI
jgi:hypothetical protein